MLTRLVEIFQKIEQIIGRIDSQSAEHLRRSMSRKRRIRLSLLLLFLDREDSRESAAVEPIRNKEYRTCRSNNERRNIDPWERSSASGDSRGSEKVYFP